MVMFSLQPWAVAPSPRARAASAPPAAARVVQAQQRHRQRLPRVLVRLERSAPAPLGLADSTNSCKGFNRDDRSKRRGEASARSAQPVPLDFWVTRVEP